MIERDMAMAAEDNYIGHREYADEELTGQELRKIEFVSATFLRCRFADCDFEGSSFIDTRMEGCDFTDCRFRSCYFKNARLVDCKGDRGDFSHGSFVRSAIKGGSYYYANFSNSLWNDCRIEDSFFSNAFMAEVKYKKVVFANVNLTSADFFKTPLKGIDLSDSRIENITVSDGYGELRGVKVNAAQALDIAVMMGVVLV